ncbi:MAG: hypothetical protein SFU53_16245 [Terrimicrobiaceae bacterium]|nr:hypothetical protein [Terrimicrobiaceae bacterium]
MTFLDRLERSLARYAIPGLIRYVVALSALVFVLVALNPGYASMLELDRDAILRGEVWRLVSWIFIPTTDSFFWIVFYLLFTWWIGDLLEQSWGTFRLNAYYFLGMILTIVSAFVFGASFGNLFLNLSLFFAVATLAPNLEILLFFVLPVKIKWVALFSLIFPLSVLVFGNLPAKMIVLVSLGNYLLFFGPAFFRSRWERREIESRRARFEARKVPAGESIHRCEVCGVTELLDPDADFRVAADGREYCTRHLPSKSP